MNLETRFKKNEKIPWRIIEEEGILVDVRKGEVIHLNEAAAAIWDSIDGENTAGRIIDCVCGRYEVDKQTARSDVTAFLNELLGKGVIEFQEEKKIRS